MPKMLHGLKVTVKTPGRRNFVKNDESLVATEQTLNHWLKSTGDLLAALDDNERAWQELFASYMKVHPVVSSIYPAHDVDVLECSAELTNIKVVLDDPPKGVESHFDAVQRVDIAKKDLNNLVTRINNAKSMHAERLEVMREYRYYEDKTRQIVEADNKRNSISQKEVERRNRNVVKSGEFEKKLHSVTTQLFYEMDAIAVERLAAADRAFAALLLLQNHYFKACPVSRALSVGSRVGLGRRVLIRDESRPWLPPTYTQSPDSSSSAMPDQTVQTVESPMYTVPPYNPHAQHHMPASQQHISPQVPQPQQSYDPTHASVPSQAPAYQIFNAAQANMYHPAYRTAGQIGYQPQPNMQQPNPNVAPTPDALHAPIPSASVAHPTQAAPAPPPNGPPMPGQSPQPIYTTATPSHSSPQSYQNNAQNQYSVASSGAVVASEAYNTNVREQQRATSFSQYPNPSTPPQGQTSPVSNGADSNVNNFAAMKIQGAS